MYLVHRISNVLLLIFNVLIPYNKLINNELTKFQNITICMCVSCTVRQSKVAIRCIVSKACSRTRIESSFSTSISKFKASPANLAESMVSVRRE